MQVNVGRSVTTMCPQFKQIRSRSTGIITLIGIADREETLATIQSLYPAETNNRNTIDWNVQEDSIFALSEGLSSFGATVMCRFSNNPNAPSAQMRPILRGCSGSDLRGVKEKTCGRYSPWSAWLPARDQDSSYNTDGSLWGGRHRPMLPIQTTMF